MPAPRQPRKRPSGATLEARISLSPRQREIVQLISSGRSNKEIAHELGLTTGTIKQHVYALFRKLGVRNRTMAVVRSAALAAASASASAQPVSDAGAAEGAVAGHDGSGLPEEMRFARRLVTAVVIEPRPGQVGSPRDGLEVERRITVFRRRAEHLARCFDGQSEPLPGGGVAAWFGQPVAHGDDAARAVAFARAMISDASDARRMPCAIGLGTVPEIVGEGDQSSLAFRAFRVATLLANFASADAPLACEQTAELADLGASSQPRWPRARADLPVAARAVPLEPAPDAFSQDWGGLPFVAALGDAARRGRCQWLAVESWPPEAGTRLIHAIGESLAAQALPVVTLWVPYRDATESLNRHLVDQLREEVRRFGLDCAAASLDEAIRSIASSQAIALLAYGIDALSTLAAALGEQSLERLRAMPLVIVAGAMQRTGAPQTVVRMLGANPRAAPFARVLRMQVPAGRPAAAHGMRPDLQALLDAVSMEARAVARVAADPHVNEVTAVARALGFAVASVVAHCRELERMGLVSLSEGRVQFRDADTAAAVRASLA